MNLHIRLFALLTLSAVLVSGRDLEPRAGQQTLANISEYVKTYAPLVYLDQNDPYLPSDLQAQLNNTYPALNFTPISTTKLPVPLPVSLSNLEQLNALGPCTGFGSCDVFLTSKDNVTTNPAWLNGVLPDAVTGETVGAKSCAVIVYDHGDEAGTVDAFYMYFYAFDQGLTVLGQVTGNHIGDWEHSMVRFVNGKPVAVWLSQHDYGQAFSYETMQKNGTRPVIYSALGSHANFAVPGTHTRTIANIALNDSTSAGPLWDPILSAYFYSFSPSSAFKSNVSSPPAGVFLPSEATTPVSWLSFYGRWGDLRYLDSDPRQVNLMNLNISWKYDTGPTGPLDKELVRADACPFVSGVTCSTLTVLPSTSGSSIPVTITRTTSTAASTKTGGSGTGGASSASPSASGKSAGVRLESGMIVVLLGILVALC